MPNIPDVYINQIGSILVVAPALEGNLKHLVEERNVVLERDGERTRALSRWIFADIAHQTLQDDWDNSYDHQVHTLLAGDLSDGLELVKHLKGEGLNVVEEKRMFVPFQTLDPNDRDSSDNLRIRHARAFAIARRERPTTRRLITSIRDGIVAGNH